MDEIKKEPEKKEPNKTPVKKVTIKKGRKPLTEEEKEQAKKKKAEIKSFCLLVGIEEKKYPNTIIERLNKLHEAKDEYTDKISKIDIELRKQDDLLREELANKYEEDIKGLTIGKLKLLKQIIEEKLEKESRK